MSTRVTTEKALRDALDTGGVIHVDDTITLSTSLPVTQPTRLLGGRIIADSGPAFEVTSSHVEFAGMRIDGGGIAAGYDETQKLIHVQGTDTAPIEGISVQDCTLVGSRADNIWIEWCTSTRIEGNRIDQYLYSGVMVVSGDGVVVSGNTISDAPLVDPVVNTYGIALTDVEDTDAARCRNCTVVGNRVHLVDWEAIDTHGGDNIAITGNLVTASPRGVALVVGNSTRSTAPTRCTVSGNTITGDGARQPLRTGVFLCGTADIAADAVVSGNTITGFDTTFYLDYVDRAATYVGGNNVPLLPWSPITLDGDYDANSSYPPEYRVDGNTVALRGGVIPKGADQRQIIGQVDSIHARPEVLTFTGYSQGSNPDAGNGMVGVWPDGTIEMFYHSGTDTYTYFLSGAYRAA